MKKNAIRAVAWISTWMLAAAGSALAQNLPGNYTVEGRDVDGKAYTGNLRITAAGPVFRLTYTDSRTQRGMGIQKGNQLFTAWGPNDKCTISALEVKADGSLEGPWADLGHDAIGTELLRKQAGAPGTVDGTYAASGRTPDGTSYDGVTTVSTRGQVLRFAFKDDAGTQDGVGIRQGQAIAVAYGGSRCGVSIYTIGADGSLSGPFAYPGDNRLGLDNIRKR